MSDRVYLGTTNREGQLTFFTKLGPFASHEAAVSYYDSKPRSGSRVDVVTIECVGVVSRTTRRAYGTRYVVRTLEGTPKKCCW